MADYIGTFFISKLPFCFEKQEMINGVEKTCLVIPCEEAQMDRTRQGAWFIRLKVSELKPNPQLRSHKIALGYRNYPNVDKARAVGYYETSQKLGHLFVNNPAPKADYTNNMTQIFCDGKLFLDSIQREDIKTDPMTGRKYVDFRFRKTERLDSFGNSHEVIVRTDYGEHQIGLAKEIRDEEGWFTPPAGSGAPEEHKQQSPEYDGYKW